MWSGRDLRFDQGHQELRHHRATEPHGNLPTIISDGNRQCQQNLKKNCAERESSNCPTGAGRQVRCTRPRDSIQCQFSAEFPAANPMRS
jgi:hypothetical protein